MLVEAFTVAENIILGNEKVKNGRLDLKQASKEIKELSEKYGMQSIRQLKLLIFQLELNNVLRF